MSGLRQEIQALSNEDRAFILKTRQKKLIGASLAFIISLILIYYALFEYYSSSFILSAFILLILALCSAGIMLQHYRLLGEALNKGEKDVFYGTVLTKYSKRARTNRGWEQVYFMVLKDNPKYRKQRKNKLKALKESWMKNEDYKALNEYEKTIAERDDNLPIQIQYSEYEQIEKGNTVELHYLTSVYLAWSIFTKDNSMHDDISADNFFKLKIVINKNGGQHPN